MTTAADTVETGRWIDGGEAGRWLVNGADDAARTLVLAHGAGAAMDSPFMAWFAGALAGASLRVVRFEFPYMRRRRESGTRAAPDPMPRLQQCWEQVIAQQDPSTLFIGGKSMGARVASMLAADRGVAGLVCLGYPFHPAGRADRLRIDHLRDLQVRTLICQGERDPMGRREEVDGYPLSDAISVEWLPDGDHGFRPRKRSGHTELQNWQRARDAVSAFVNGP